jgi:hypothetical protein
MIRFIVRAALSSALWIVVPAFAETPAAPGTDAAAPAKAARQTFGGALTDASETTFAELVSNVDKYDGKTVKVAAVVSSVCRKKGCWMVLGDPTAKSPVTVRVTMKDYGFFVPKDCDGKSALVEGVFKKKVLSEAMAKHYASDGGQDPSKVSGDKLELSLVANGVVIQ